MAHIDKHINHDQTMVKLFFRLARHVVTCSRKSLEGPRTRKYKIAIIDLKNHYYSFQRFLPDE